MSSGQLLCFNLSNNKIAHSLYKQHPYWRGEGGKEGTGEKEKGKHTRKNKCWSEVLSATPWQITAKSFATNDPIDYIYPASSKCQKEKWKSYFQYH